MAKKKPTNSPATPIAAVKHAETRKNIPTEELRGFVPADDPARPPAALYPRNADLDPQLVWKGKDEQDAAPLEAPVVPIYIQEKVHPQAIIEDFRSSVASKSHEAAAGLFADFNGLPAEFDQRVDFYQHDGHWSNRLILGDSLMAMASLSEKEGLKGRVQMIYFDPPYGIKFGSNWQVSTRKRDVKDGRAEDVIRQPEQIKAFRDTWKLGIHSYLSYLRDRLTAARELLTESGSIFVQIGDENVHLVRCVLDEVFGAENFCALIQFQKTGAFDTNLLQRNFDSIIWFSKQKAVVKFRPPLLTRAPVRYDTTFFDHVQQPDGTRRPLTAAEENNPTDVPARHRLFARNPLNSEGWVESLGYEVQFEGADFRPPANRHWTTTEAGIRRLNKAGRLMRRSNTLRFVRYWDDYPARTAGVVWTDTGTGGFFGDEKVYVVQTDSGVIKRCILMTTDPGDLVLDPTCGSGTTAYVAEQWGRRWITADTSRVALTLARTRIMAARFPYYLLSDSAEGIRKEAELAGQMVPAQQLARTEGDIHKGFVYKRVPHVTLKSIANNEEIDVIHARFQEQLEPLRKKLNTSLKNNWEEWEVPRETDGKWPAAAVKLHGQWWELRRARQAEMDASIARKAGTETLYDQPYEDAKRVRVSGPFTVESMSPHRTISAREKAQRAAVPDANGIGVKLYGADKFGHLILDNLRTAGVQNTKKGQRLKFDSLEVFPGEWIQGEGRYTDADGKAKRAAIALGPEHGTVDCDLIKEAAKEAVRGAGFDLLVVCGFAFDPHVAEEARNYGKLVVLPTRINPDLEMGDLLKKTGAANLFTVFGEPDIAVETTPDGQLVVELKGLDVFDPTTGEVRSSSVDDIACWFIDTDYNGESFFVRHAYFTGVDEPYEKLQRALRAEIDESAWQALYSTRSRPFPKPQSGKIAIKVINHYGDEVLKVSGVR